VWGSSRKLSSLWPRTCLAAVSRRAASAGGSRGGPRCAAGVALAAASALALVAASALAQAPPPSVSARVSRDEVSVGEPFTVELRASGPDGTTWMFPPQAGSDAVELVTEPAPSPSPGASAPPPPAPGTWRYRATVFAVKDVAVPPITVRYRLPDGGEGEATSASVRLRLRSLLPKDPKEQTLADVRPPLPLSIGWPFWAGLGLLLSSVAALVWLVARRRRRATPLAAPAAPALAPDAEALQALDALGASDMLARGEYRPFYIALAEVAKRYLERRLDAPVLEMTSTETLGFLRGHAHGGPLVATMRDLMGAADQVKFARGAGQAAEARRHLDAARAVIATLEARLRPAAAERTVGAPR
jgi:hypothetical protein